MTTIITPRQKQVMDGLIEGQSYKEIAYSLRITERTVKFHAADIYKRFNIEPRKGRQVLQYMLANGTGYLVADNSFRTNHWRPTLRYLLRYWLRRIRSML